MVRVHLSGMGLLGCLTARMLARHGVLFTWDDPEKEVNAWRACTGACYPSGGLLDSECHRRWLGWAADGTFPSGCLEVCRYWVDTNTKSLPHGLAADVEATAGGVRLVGRSVHVNAQKLVTDTRHAYRTLRRGGPGPGVVYVTSHGFGSTLTRYLWGWTRLVRLRYSREVSARGRPSFYLRRNRFQFAYCYPQPGTGWWYAGSSLVNQTVAKDLDPVPRYESWKRWFAELTGGAAEVAEEGQYLTGWRPKGAGGTSGSEGAFAERGPMLADGPGGGVFYPSLATGGFRHFPTVWDELAARLGVDKQQPPGG